MASHRLFHLLYYFIYFIYKFELQYYSTSIYV